MGKHTDTRYDRSCERKIVEYAIEQDFLQYLLVQTPPNGISYRTRRCIRYQTGFLTAQDGAYHTKRNSLPHKTVHTAPNGISYTVSIPDHCPHLENLPNGQVGPLSVHFIVNPLKSPFPPPNDLYCRFIKNIFVLIVPR
jgi:hypothetical protein